MPTFVPYSDTFYPEVVQRFIDQPFVRPVCRDDIEPWRKGRERYWFWCIELDDPAVLARYQRYQKRLSPFLLGDNQRQLHITLAVCGFWLGDEHKSRFNDDFGKQQLAVHCQNLAAYSGGHFELQVLGGNSFLSAPFLEVVDNSSDRKLRQLRDCLLDTRDDFRSSAYYPHITLGLYDCECRPCELLPLLIDDKDREPLTIEVSALSLMSYDSADLKGALKLEQRVLLSS